MFKRFSSMPIFRRLFLAFFLAVVIPDLIILMLSLFYTHALLAHGVSSRETGPFTLGTILALLASTAIVVALGSFINMTITQPLNHLASLAKRIREGETSARALIMGRDEIALVASSINRMLDQIVSLLQETRGQRDALQGQVEKLLNEVSGIGAGDLSIQAEVTYGSLGVLADSFNYMVEALSALVIRVKRVAVEVETATTTTQQEMTALVTAAETQLHQISGTARTIDAMVQACLHVVERTQMLDRAAKEARSVAQQGRESIEQTQEGMGLIHQNAQRTASQVQILATRSAEIDEVVTVLEHIVQQTNRLALDAAIQVAMAGDTGASGFGAVAEGMRRLAEETKTQLSTVAHKVKSVRTEITRVADAIGQAERETATGATRIQATGASLSTIFRIVEEQAHDIETIAQMSEQLLRSSHEVSLIMNSIAGTTMAASTRTRSVAQQMRQVTQLVKHLRVSVEVFRVKDAEMAASRNPSLPREEGSGR